jgi:hypothetical protein
MRAALDAFRRSTAAIRTYIVLPGTRHGGLSASPAIVRRAIANSTEQLLLTHAAMRRSDCYIAFLLGLAFLMVVDLLRGRDFAVVLAIRCSDLLVHSHDFVGMVSR